MQTISIAAIPNQSFNVTLDNVRYNFEIYIASDGMCYNLSINETAVFTGQRICGGTFLIPFFAYENVNGNFLLLTQNYELPNYTQFGLTQILIYLSYNELQTAVNNQGSQWPNVAPYAVAL